MASDGAGGATPPKVPRTRRGRETRLAALAAKIAVLRDLEARVDAAQRSWQAKRHTRRMILLGAGLIALARSADAGVAAAARAHIVRIVDRVSAVDERLFNGWDESPVARPPSSPDPASSEPAAGDAVVAKVGRTPRARAAQLESLPAKIAALEAEQARVDAAHKTWHRKRDTRRKIILGAGLLGFARADDESVAGAALALMESVVGVLAFPDAQLFSEWDESPLESRESSP